MAPIIPAGGKKMEWVKNPDVVEKTAQDMFDDDPQLEAIKDLPGMQDGIDELQEMSAECPCVDGNVTPADETLLPETSTELAGGDVAQAIEKVKDAAQEVADAAAKEVEQAVTDAVQNVGTIEVAPVADKLDEISMEDHEQNETPAEEAKEESNKSEDNDSDDKKDDTDSDIPGVIGDTDGIEKEGDQPEIFASSKGMRRLAELSSDETKELRQYWEKLLGFPKEYVDAMLKKYRA